MQIVIDIDEKTYESLIRAKEKCPSALTLIEWNIANATPIPKGNGRLVDVDRLKEVFKRNVAGAEAFDDLFNNSPTVIEADKE